MNFMTVFDLWPIERQFRLSRQRDGSNKESGDRIVGDRAIGKPKLKTNSSVFRWPDDPISRWPDLVVKMSAYVEAHCLE